MNFEITDDEKELILKRRQEQGSAKIGMRSASEKSRREPEFSAFADEMKRMEQTGFLAD
jgi:hypothetical protein